MTILGASITAFLLIRSIGDGLTARQAHGRRAVDKFIPSNEPSMLFHVLLALAIILVVTRIVAAILRKVNQPQVMAEVISGILLGPSFFGWLAPSVSSQALPASITPNLGLISQIGVMLYMFLVGLDLDSNLLRKCTEASIAISHASIIVPFLLGAALALWLYPLYSPSAVPFSTFALFVGVVMSVTALPVLARILADCAMQNTRLGVLALACAAVDDVTAWTLLTLVVSMAHARIGNILRTLIPAIGFTVFVLVFAKRCALWFVQRHTPRGRTTRNVFSTVCIVLLLSALVTERIGIHALFGAFLLGAVIPHNSALARDIREKCEYLVVVLLLPLFFALTGIRTQVSLLHGTHDWLICIVIIATASLSKFGGSFFAARWTGLDWCEAASLGVLMNTRGLMELIVLNVGLDLGILSPALFTMFVLMAVVTTLLTTPILHALQKSRVCLPGWECSDI